MIGWQSAGDWPSVAALCNGKVVPGSVDHDAEFAKSVEVVEKIQKNEPFEKGWFSTNVFGQRGSGMQAALYYRGLKPDEFEKNLIKRMSWLI
jgi:hypothetical protein